MAHGLELAPYGWWRRIIACNDDMCHDVIADVSVAARCFAMSHLKDFKLLVELATANQLCVTHTLLGYLSAGHLTLTTCHKFRHGTRHWLSVVIMTN